jgi:hypothetical protein
MKSSKHPLLHVAFSLLAAAFTLPAAGPASPAACPGRMPVFSWDHVPRYMHIRKDTAFTPAEIQYLASFPLITFEKSTGNKDSGSTEAGTLKAARAVKAINPAAKILYYRNVIVHYGGYAASDALKNIPRAFLVGSDGSDKLVRGRVQAYNLASQPMRDWWLATAGKVCADPAIDGLFLDGVVKVLEPDYLSKEIGKEKKAAALAGYAMLMKATRQMLGPDKLMVANVLRARFPDSGLDQMKAFDGSYIEGFEGAVGKMSRKDYVAKGIAAFQAAARQGAIIAFTASPENNLQDADETPQEAAAPAGNTVLSPGAVGQDLDERKRSTYLLAMFLICAEKYSYFDLKDGYDAKQSKVWMTHPPEFARPLGAPQGPAVRAGYLYTREFAHASVRLDIEKQTGEVIWH